MIFECHITCNLKHIKTAAAVADGHGWKPSTIEGDITLGKESYFYLTKHSRDYMSLFNEMQRCANALRLTGCEVIREKIELIMYDTKLNKPIKFVSQSVE